jgi:multisubunit Na+/H+ antiporter MnhG subunit
MLLEEIKNIRTDKPTLRKFGIGLFVLLMIFSAISLWKAGDAYRYLAPTAALSLLTAFMFPIALKFIFLPWMALATVIGWLMTRVILISIFYLLITPFSFIMKLTGKDLLDEKIEPQRKSYWVPRDKKTISKEELQRQF